MIYYTVQTSTQFTVGEAVQKASNGSIESHSSGEVLGVVRSSVEITENEYATQIYAAGGGGSQMILGTDWDGSPSRFQFQSGRVHPVSSGGDGWLIPDFPQQAKVTGDLILGCIYR